MRKHLNNDLTQNIYDRSKRKFCQLSIHKTNLIGTLPIFAEFVTGSNFAIGKSLFLFKLEFGGREETEDLCRVSGFS